MLGEEKSQGYTLSTLDERFAICRLDANADIPPWAVGYAFFSITRTPEELSIVCPVSVVPPEVLADRGWRALKVRGPLDFGMVGVLSTLIAPLARAGISIFALSTYDTDYLLVKEQAWSQTIAALREAGHTITGEE